MRIVYFTHSLVSCWNHGNAHFLRGVLGELQALGHEVRVFEPADAWSLRGLIAERGAAALSGFQRTYPQLSSRTYAPDVDVEALLAGADLVLVHEWNEPWLVAAVGRARRRGRFSLFFHDTHHRAVSDPRAIGALPLGDYDAVLAFGESLAETYRRRGWGRRAFVWHEAADTRVFRPPTVERRREGLVWIGNWGDDERSGELEEFLLAPAHTAALALDVYGVRYPPEALEKLRAHGASWRGWAPNADVPRLFAGALATVHVPRRYYVERLPGVPTIRVFEALACGVPLVSAPWNDAEGLFGAGDFVLARDREAMTAALRALACDAGLRAELAARGSRAIAARHTCAHRARELMRICAEVAGPGRAAAASAA
ncbi:MAG TPA: glycosyltransferase [Caulobacteraceae bacterium]|nr:glycosyltransferase [Caulobacteraceae bacterium]